jgi:hypothetical protein
LTSPSSRCRGRVPRPTTSRSPSGT